MSLTDRFWAWAATRRDRLVTAALEDDPIEQEHRRLLEAIDEESDA